MGISPLTQSWAPWIWRRRWTAIGLLALVCLLLPAPDAAAAASDTPLLTGVVVDPFGKALEGVRILIATDLTASDHQVSVTDSQGRYLFSGLVPAAYQLFAVKPGFRIRLLRVDMVLRRSMDFTLFPVPDADSTSRTKDTDPLGWVLRIPAGDILKDLQQPDDSTTGERNVTLTPARPAVVALVPGNIQGEFLYLQTAGSPFPGSGDSRVERSGKQSRVRMEGDLGDRMNWFLEGDLRRASRILAADTEPGGKAFQTGEVAVGMNFAPSREDDVSFSLLFGKSSLKREDPFADPFSPRTNQEQEAWGYDARWSRNVDSMSHLDFRVRYQQGLVSLPDPGQDHLGAQLGPAASTVDHSLWDAGGQYRLVVDDRHELLLGMRTRVYDTGLEGREDWLLIPLLSGGDGAELTALAGWDIDFFGEDQWKISEPFRLVYGLTYSVSDSVRAEEIVIPKVVFHHRREDGMEWNAGLLLAWGTPRNQAVDAAGDRQKAETEVGYVIGLSHPLPQGFRVAVSASSHPAAGIFPALESPAGETYATASVFQQDPYVGHRRVQAKEIDIQVEKRFRHAVGRLGSTVGSAEGLLAANLEEIAPLLELNPGTLRYVATRLQTVLDRSETEFQIGYRRVSEEGESAGATAGALRKYLVLDFQVVQRLAFLETLSRSQWKVIFAYQDVKSEIIPGTGAASYQDPASTYSRLSGGVQVRF